MIEKMVKITFTVNRKRSDMDGYPDLVECTIFRPESYCKKIDCDLYETYDDRAYDRFCDEAASIVRYISGTYCGLDWFFENSPEFHY